MSDLLQRLYVGCPVSRATDRLTGFFRERAGDGAWEAGKPIRVALRAPIPLPSLRTNVILQHDVIATLRHLPQTWGNDCFDVTCEPSGGGVFPHFTGTLSIENNEEYDSFSLVLKGSYDPPLGPAGQAFDAALGHRIAIATARDLLARIRDEIEKSEESEEQEKISQHLA
jgi:hypothetical protein